MVNIFPFSYLSFTLRLQPGDFTEECAENGTEPKAIVRSNSKSVSGGGTRDPSRKGERPEKPLKDQDKVHIYDSFSDVGESRVWFASKNLTSCRMH